MIGKPEERGMPTCALGRGPGDGPDPKDCLGPGARPLNTEYSAEAAN